MDSWRNLPPARANIPRLVQYHHGPSGRSCEDHDPEQGKVIAESRGEVADGASYIEWFAEQVKRIDGDVIPGPSPDKRIVCITAQGFGAAITPWNFPMP